MSYFSNYSSILGLVHGLFVLPVLVTTFCPTYKAEPLSVKELVPLGVEDKDLPDRNGNSEAGAEWDEY